MAGKYYGVYNGREGSRVYSSWAEAEKNVKGVKGVRYKGFSSEAEAVSFIEGGGKYTVVTDTETKKTDYLNTRKSDKSFELSDGLLAYVDGSFKEGKKCWGWGLVVLLGGNVIHEDYGSGSREDTVSMRNVAGEVEGAMEAMKFALRKGYGSIHIFYDYMGVECWATGAWKRNNHLTYGYHDFYNSIKENLTVNFHKVKGHSGDIWNDRADQLAKKAVDEFCP